MKSAIMSALDCTYHKETEPESSNCNLLTVSSDWTTSPPSDLPSYLALVTRHDDDDVN